LNLKTKATKITLDNYIINIKFLSVAVSFTIVGLNSKKGNNLAKKDLDCQLRSTLLCYTASIVDILK